ncbi:MAG TPA: hypothetical protein VK445_05655 [Dissulfurispiraceae bacterium]|nr:hypothetical protein [Dissulfurispiraceae bacterium]
MPAEIPLEKELAQLLLTTAVARMYNTLDVAHIADKLSDDIVYESQQVLTPLRGRAEVLEYLNKKFETISKTPNSLLFVELAFLGNLDDSFVPIAFAREGQPCLIMAQGTTDNRLALVLVNELEGRISRIDLCTVAPHWSQAEGTGEYPK